MEIRKIKLMGQMVEYQLNIKPIKRCYLKVVSGKIIVNSSPLFSTKDIEALIIQNQETILKRLNSYVGKFDYCNGGFVNIFNRRYQIVSYDLNKRQVKIHDDKLYVYHHQIQNTIEMYLKEVLLQYITSKIQTYLQTSFKLTMPKIEIKKYKARWGACYPVNNKVSFNLALVHLDKDLIDYVIVHELCHFLQANHSKLFYQEIKKRLPDYQKREKQLKEIGI